MNTVLEFPSKVFNQWGAIAQEIAPYLARHGAKKEEIRAVVERLKTRWEQLESAPTGSGTVIEMPAKPGAAEVSGSLEESDRYVSRHWRSQSARTLIESAMADYQRNPRP